MAMTIEFFVPGPPETAGSKKSFVKRAPWAEFLKGATRDSFRMMTPDQLDMLLKPEKLCRAIVTDDNPKGDAWKKKAALVARTVYQGPPLTGPLQLDVTFILARPQGHFGTGKNAGVLKPGAPQYPTTRPDATKLLRCIEDGLTGVIWADDSQIVFQTVAKEYGHTEGAKVAVAPFEDTLF